MKKTADGNTNRKAAHSTPIQAVDIVMNMKADILRFNMFIVLLLLAFSVEANSRIRIIPKDDFK
ncbi:hypothetical protein LJC56_01475 [Christensenellaceae bacterium OttesenSCG-928-K19]|nr:hypothetical protein [Christensenellaceae bacterium OttesenSCG-928-K19]